MNDCVDMASLDAVVSDEIKSCSNCVVAVVPLNWIPWLLRNGERWQVLGNRSTPGARLPVWVESRFPLQLDQRSCGNWKVGQKKCLGDSIRSLNPRKLTYLNLSVCNQITESDSQINQMQNDLLTELGRSLLNSSLDDERLMAQTGGPPAVQILPEANVIKIGGQSIIDRGRAAVFPLLEEIVENLGRHKMIIGTGAGTRARHAYSVGLDLGLPTGVLSVLGTFVSMQNARMLNYLLAKHGIPFIEPAQFAQLPHYLAERGAVIFFGMPPYIYWHGNPDVGRIPPNRTDTGCYLVSEVFGARSMIFVKDEKGLYTADPKKDRNAKFIPTITIAELEQLDLHDVVVERSVLELMPNATHQRSIQVINGLGRGNLTRALNGEHVGTIISAD